MASVERDAYLNASIIGGKSPHMDAAAARLKRNLVSEAAKHRLTGALLSSFFVASVRGLSGTGTAVTDRIVGSTDEAILSINYGHIAGKRPHRESQRVPGKYIFEKALASS